MNNAKLAALHFEIGLLLRELRLEENLNKKGDIKARIKDLLSESIDLVKPAQSKD